MVDQSKETPKGATRARFIATFALAGFGCAVGYAGIEGYHAVTDAFVAPAILSPESEVVLQTKAKVAELDVERARILAEAESIDADLAAADKAVARLHQLETTMSSALEWTKDTTARQAFASTNELHSLEEQRKVLVEMAQKQQRVTTDADANLSANLISRSDQAKEKLALDQVNLALLENNRARQQNQATLQQAYSAHIALTTNGTMMPEQIAREEQVVRIGIEIARLESEQRSKSTVKRVVLAKMAKMDEIALQIRARPLFRATEKSVEVAFVPYTQLDGVSAGAPVFECTWGIFRCKPVGRIGEVVPGEVILPDPWGNPSRGQYAVLDLDTHSAARSKVLRVRGTGTVTAPGPTPTSPITVSAR